MGIKHWLFQLKETNLGTLTHDEVDALDVDEAVPSVLEFYCGGPFSSPRRQHLTPEADSCTNSKLWMCSQTFCSLPRTAEAITVTGVKNEEEKFGSVHRQNSS
jgi:hypothetical protein